MDLTVSFIAVAALVACALATVMMARLLWAVLGLALTSAVLTAIMFRLQAPIAGVFELSVCAGLIPAIFITAISLTRRLTPEGLSEAKKEKSRRFALLPIFLILAAVAFTRIHIPFESLHPAAAGEANVRDTLWNLRQIDLVGQIACLLGGVFAVVILIKEPNREQ